MRYVLNEVIFDNWYHYRSNFFHETDPSSSKMSIAFTKEMALAAGLLLLLVFFCNGAYGADANNKLVCEETYFLHYDITAVISCEYERSFLTVRWYFNGAGKSFLRIDGETFQKRGSGYDSGEYDIQDDGSMVIKRTDVKHEGIYKIAVLHSDGSSSQENIAIFIVVPLKSLIIHDCGSRRIELCPGELFEESSDAVLCIAKDSWLPVDLAWQTLGPNGIAVDVSSKYTSVHKRDNISSLFTSSSTLQYEKESFVLQKFTCVASDRANKTTLTNSLLVSGDYPPLRSSLAERNVNEGSSFHMKCPVESKPLAQLYVTFFDGISKLLMETNTNTFQQVCVDESCQVKNNNIVVFDNVSHKQEGVYRCISSDGTTAEGHVLDVTVLISPTNAAVNINGCASTESCKRNGTKPGSLTCSVSGFRPPVELTMTEDDDSKQEVKLTNHRRETTTDPESGTSESYLTADYAIIGCDGTASLTCRARPDNFARKIKPSKITITTDKVKCMDDPVTEKKGKGGLIAGLLVVFAIIAAIVVFLVFWTRKKGISKSEGKQSEETESCLLPVGQAQTNADETDVEVEGASTNEKKEKQALLSTSENQETDVADTESKDKNEDTKQKKVKTSDKKKKEKKKITKPKNAKAQKKLQEEFNKTFLPIFEMESPVNKEWFKEELEKFITKHEKENTLRLLGVFIKGRELDEEKLLLILECLELEKEVNVKSSPETVEILRIIAEEKKVSDKCLQITKQQYLQNKIKARDFATITSAMRELHKMDELLKCLEDSNESQKEPFSEAVDALVQYAILKPLTDTEQHRTVSYNAKTVSKIKYIKIVQAIQERYGEGKFKKELKEFLKTFAEKVLARENATFKEEILRILEDNQPEEEEITSVFIRMLLFSVERKLITIDECMDMLQSGLKRKKLTNSVFTKVPCYSLTERCLSKQLMFQILREAFVRKQIAEDEYFRTLEGTLKEKQIQIIDYMGELTHSVDDKLITKENMMDELRRSAMENLGNEVYYCYQLNHLLKFGQLTTTEYTEELQFCIDNKWVKRSHVVEGLQESLQNKLIDENLFLGQICEVHEGGESNEHLEALKSSKEKLLISDETLLSQFQELLKNEKLDSMGYIAALVDCVEKKLILETNFLQQLRVRLIDKKIDLAAYRNQLESCVEKKTVKLETYITELDSLWKEKKIEQLKYMEALRNCWKKEMMTEERFFEHLLNLLKSSALKYDDVTTELKLCFRQTLIKDTTFFSQLLSIVKISKKDLMKEHESCLREKVITDDGFRDQLLKLLQVKELQITDFMEGLKRCVMEKLITIKFFLSTMHSALEEKMLTPAEFAAQLLEVVKTPKLDAEAYINEMRTCLHQKMIKETLFITELSKVSDSGKLDIGGLVSELRNCLDKKLISQDLFCKKLNDFFNEKKIDLRKFINELQICLEKEWIKENIFLAQLTDLFVKGQMPANDFMGKLHECVRKGSLSQASFLGQVSNLFITGKLTKKALMEEYLTCLGSKLKNVDVFCDQLRLLLSKEKIKIADYLDTLKTALEKELLSKSSLMERFHKLVEENLITKEGFFDQLKELLNTKKLTIKEILEEYRNCLKTNLISLELFGTQMDHLLSDKTIDVGVYLDTLEMCLAEESIKREYVVSTLRDLLKDKFIEESVFLNRLQNLCSNDIITINEYVNELWDCLETSLIPAATFVAQLDTLLKDEKMDTERYFKELASCQKKNIISQDTVCEKLNHLLAINKLDVMGLIAALQTCLHTDVIDRGTFFGQLYNMFVENKISRGDLMAAFHLCLQNKKVKVNDYWNQLFCLLKNEKLSISDYVQELNNDEKSQHLTLQHTIEKIHSCRKESLMTEEELCDFLENLLQNAKLDINEYNIELQRSLETQLISKEMYNKRIEEQEEKKKADFNDAFQTLWNDVASEKGTDDNFQLLLRKFNQKYKELPSTYLEAYIDTQEIEQEKLIGITTFLAGSNESNLFTHPNKLDTVQCAVKKLPAEASLSLLVAIYSLQRITVEEFVGKTKILLDEKKIDAKAVLAKLREISKSECPGVEIADTVIQFFVQNIMTQDEILFLVGYKGVGSKKVSHVYFLQAIQGFIGQVQGQAKNTLHVLFNKILTKALDNEVNFCKQATGDLKKEEVRKKFLRILLFNVQQKWISADECIAVLKACQHKEQIEEKDLEEMPSYYLKQHWLDKSNFMQMSRKCLRASVISENTYKTMLKDIKKKRKITEEEYKAALQICSGK